MSSQLSRWRPVQGIFHLYVTYTGARGLIVGPVPGQALADVVGPGQSILTVLFYGSLFIGGLAAMIGELRQLKHYKESSCIEKYIDGLSIESAGAILISLNYLSLAITVYASPAVPDSRANVYIAIFVGFLGRACQAIWDIYRIKKTIREVGKTIAS